MFVIHHEPENAPAHAAAETMKRLPLRTDVERGRFLLVKRAERFEVRARAFEREIRPDHVDDIVRGGDLLDGLRWNCHGPNGKLNRRSASWKYEDVIVNLKRGRACPADGRARGGHDSQRRCRRRAVARRDLALAADVFATR